MKRIVWICILAVIIISAFAGCASNKTSSSAEKDVADQIDIMLGVSYRQDEDDLFGGALGQNSILSQNEYGQKICERVEYEIENTEIDGESGKVTIRIKYPDVYTLLKESAVEFDSKDDVDEFLAMVSQKLESDYPETEKTVLCDIIFENEKWSVVANKDLLDALSGNLYSAYFEMADNVIENMTEE